MYLDKTKKIFLQKNPKNKELNMLILPKTVILAHHL